MLFRSFAMSYIFAVALWPHAVKRCLMTSNRRGVMPASENRSRRRRRRTLCEQIIIINVPEDEESADHSNGAAPPLTNGPRMAVDRKPFYQLPIKTPCYRLDMYFSNPLQLGRIMRKVLFSPFGINNTYRHFCFTRSPKNRLEFRWKFQVILKILYVKYEILFGK